MGKISMYTLNSGNANINKDGGDNTSNANINKDGGDNTGSDKSNDAHRSSQRIRRGRKRNYDARLFFSDSEMELLKARMEEAGQPSRSRFLRRLALEGRVVRLDTAPIAELLFLVRNAANNINQIARKANISGAVVSSDVARLREQVMVLKRDAGKAAALVRNMLVD